MLSKLVESCMSFISRLSQEHDHTSSMNERRPNVRHQRRLPKVPPRRVHRDGWMNYRDSELWLQRHQEIIHKSISLLELHPRLLQHKSCDRLWDFISKLHVYNHDENTQPVNEPPNGVVEMNAKCGPRSIPVISVSECNVRYKKDPSPIKRVYVCGQSDETRWHRLVLGLCEKFLVKYISDERVGKDTNCNDCQDFVHVDVFLFIIDDLTIRDPTCLKLLRAAINQNIQVLFVRHEDYHLPEYMSTIDDDVFGLAKDGNMRHQNNKVSFTLDGIDSRCSLRSDDISSTSTSTSIIDNALPKSESQTSRLSENSTACIRRDNIDPDGSAINDTTNNAARIITPIEIVRQISNIDLPEPTNTRRPSDETDCFIREGYKQASVYNTNNHVHCLDHIIANIEEKRRCSFPHIENTIKPLYNTLTNDPAANIDDFDETLEPKVVIQNRKPIKPRRESVDTVFFVCGSSDLTTTKEPAIVEYPWELDEVKVPLSPSMDSFGFQDFDLSKAINELDLFTKDGQDDFS